jgi:hypothetical protein
MKFCNKCNQEFPNRENYCTLCGEKLADLISPTANLTQSEQFANQSNTVFNANNMSICSIFLGGVSFVFYPILFIAVNIVYLNRLGVAIDNATPWSMVAIDDMFFEMIGFSIVLNLFFGFGIIIGIVLGVLSIKKFISEKQRIIKSIVGISVNSLVFLGMVLSWIYIILMLFGYMAGNIDNF